MVKRTVTGALIALVLTPSLGWAVHEIDAKIKTSTEYPGVRQNGNLNQNLLAIGKVQVRYDGDSFTAVVKGSAKVENRSGVEQEYEDFAAVNNRVETFLEGRFPFGFENVESLYEVKASGSAKLVASAEWDDPAV